MQVFIESVRRLVRVIGYVNNFHRGFFATRRHRRHGNSVRDFLLLAPSIRIIVADMNSLLSRINTDPTICHGKPVIRNLRYPVDAMLEYLAAGDSIDDVLAELPDLQREDPLACLEFAAQSSRGPSAVLNWALMNFSRSAVH